MKETELDSPYLRAAKQILEVFNYGDLIPHKVIMDAFDLPAPSSLKEFEEYSLKRLAALERLKSHLLENNNMLLVSVRGEGYEIVDPEKQTQYAMQKCGLKIAKAISDAMLQMTFIDTEKLSDEELKENRDAKAKLLSINKFSNKKLK